MEVVEEGGDVLGVDCNFNGWGDRQVHANDAGAGRSQACPPTPGRGGIQCATHDRPGKPAA
ncbi:hypothetical protein [Streptomyces sp. N35]|uniref:hypothetical protein n=1 Tax=Streptomyces sp. N35 TaxID=2795730 RepID=UPI0018F7ACFF|nr:hypothetical protein [Streptomyces sp. N35]